MNDQLQEEVKRLKAIICNAHRALYWSGADYIEDNIFEILEKGMTKEEILRNEGHEV